MRVVVQRVAAARVTIAGEPGVGEPGVGEPGLDETVVGEIDRGLLLLVGIAPTDTEAELTWMANKCLSLRLFPAPASDGPVSPRWDRSVQDIQGDILVVSQFTLYGDCRKGRRPAFDGAAPPAQAEACYERFVALLRASGQRVATGIFGAAMQVHLQNDGPVTLLLEREAVNCS